jgi:hypothetical protein
MFEKNIDIFWDDKEDLLYLHKTGYISDDQLTEKAIKIFSNNNFNSWMKEWLLLWPTEVLSNGYRVSGNTLQCVSNMNRFLINFPEYTKEDVTEATKRYLTQRESDNWKYVKKNAKFINDSEGSTLEAECQALKENKKIQTNNKYI